MSPLDIFALAGALLVFAGCFIVLGFGARMWADAAAAVHRSRAHGIEADMQRETIERARDMAERAFPAGSRPATADEIRRSLLEQRMAGQGNGASEGYEEYTTSGDVTPDELNTHLQGGEFRQPTG